MSRHIVIAGGSGFLGTSLATSLTQTGHSVTVLSRSSNPRTDVPWRFVTWDARKVGDWIQTLDGCDGVVNLTGRTVDCIKTPDHQDEILRSRVESTLVLGQAMRKLRKPPPVWVQMSTAHIYGDPPEVRCTEDSPHGFGLAPHVAESWEAAFAEAVLPEQRQVIVRTSFVIGKDRGAGGGALSKLTWLTRWGLGGRVASGKQGMSWIHEADMNAIFQRCLFVPNTTGTYIASSPNPCSQREFMRELRVALGIRIGLPASEWMVRIGAQWILRTDPELALYGRYVIPERLSQEGFTFQFPSLGAAFDDLLT